MAGLSVICDLLNIGLHTQSHTPRTVKRFEASRFYTVVHVRAKVYGGSQVIPWTAYANKMSYLGQYDGWATCLASGNGG